MIFLILLSILLVVVVLFRITKSSLIIKLIASFDNSKDGFSARKLSAFAGVTVSIIATFRFVDNATIIEALMVWLCFGLLCLGIITAEQVIRFRNKGVDPIIPPAEEAKKDEPKKTESQSIDPKI